MWSRVVRDGWPLLVSLAIYLALRGPSGAYTPLTAPDFYRFTSEAGRLWTNVWEYLDRSATASVLGAEEFPLTTNIDVAVLASTRGYRLFADANLLARIGNTLVLATTVRVEREDGHTVCGAGTVTLRAVKP